MRRNVHLRFRHNSTLYKQGCLLITFWFETYSPGIGQIVMITHAWWDKHQTGSDYL